MWRFGGTAVAALAVLVMLAGCQAVASPTTTSTTPAPTVTSPSPEPSFTCTPEAGGDEYACTQAQHDEMVAKDALYAEAEEVARRLFAENIRITRAGGVTEPTQVLLENSERYFLEDVMTEYRKMRSRGWLPRGEDPVIVRIERLAGRSKEGSIAALRVCTDATKWAFYKGDVRKSTGALAEDDLYFTRTDGVLKALGADGREVERCGE
jgi:hypothetical protein